MGALKGRGEGRIQTREQSEIKCRKKNDEKEFVKGSKAGLGVFSNFSCSLVCRYPLNPSFIGCLCRAVPIRLRRER